MEENESLNREACAIWNENAPFWDDYMGDEGNDFQKTLVGFPTERLLDLQPGEMVLDAACGSGIFARRIAALGAQVVAFDFSKTFIERAKARNTPFSDRIDYRVIDGTDESALLSLGERRFDAAVCTMALMDMAEIDPLISALSQLLKPGGRFVFSVCHPCFNANGAALAAEQREIDGEIRTEYFVKVSRYTTPFSYKGIGIRGQPAAQYYFHRPISALFNACFRAGFVLDALEEPSFTAGDPKRTFTWENYPEIPPALVARMRLLR